VGFYPYSGAVIGQWGFDIATSTLYAPGSNYDYMSYCGPEWTSDFTYQGIFNAWSWVTQPFGAAAAAAAEESWVISGYRDTTGQWHVAPARMQAVPANATQAGGPMVLELLDSAGQVLTQRPFALQPISLDRLHSGLDLAGFRVAMRSEADVAGFRIRDGQSVLFQRQVTGRAPALPIKAAWTASNTEARFSLAAGVSQPDSLTYEIRYSPDGGTTWVVLGLDQTEPAFAMPRSLLKGASAPVVRVMASDGVRVASRIYPVPASVILVP
jgi:hypothetical protein